MSMPHRFSATMRSAHIWGVSPLRRVCRTGRTAVSPPAKTPPAKNAASTLTTTIFLYGARYLAARQKKGLRRSRRATRAAR